MWKAVTVALLINVLLFGSTLLWPHTRPSSSTDFVAVNPLVTDEFLPKPVGPSVCSLHDIEMEIINAPIVYGLPWELSDPEGFRRAHPEEPPRTVRDTQFPHAERWAWGGCCTTQQKTQRIYLCLECEKAEKEWKLSRGR